VGARIIALEPGNDFNLSDATITAIMVFPSPVGRTTRVFAASAVVAILL
jgi:hypothetical protein